MPVHGPMNRVLKWLPLFCRTKLLTFMKRWIGVQDPVGCCWIAPCMSDSVQEMLKLCIPNIWPDEFKDRTKAYPITVRGFKSLCVKRFRNSRQSIAEGC